MTRLHRGKSDRLYSVVASAFAIVAILGVMVTLVTGLITGLLLQHGYVGDNLQLIARQAAYSVEVPIVFGDKKSINDVLSPLLDDRSVSGIVVKDMDGRILLTVRPKNSDDGQIFAMPAWVLPSDVSAPVVSAGAQIGTVTVKGSASGASQQLLGSLLGAILGIILIAFGTVIVARRLNRTLINPLRQISNVTNRVRDERRLELRVPVDGLFEVRTLASDINNLLIQLQDWQGQMDASHTALLHHANYDPVSGLPNHATFMNRVRDSIQVAQRTGGSFAVLALDTDNFANALTQFGAPAAERVIAEIGTRLSAVLRVGDIAARMDGDQFAILVNHLKGSEDAQIVARRIREALNRPISVNDSTEVMINLYVGIAIFPSDGGDVESLLRIAEGRKREEKTATRH